MTMTPPDTATGDGSFYVITLCTASLPMTLRVPFVHELVGFSVFRSRTVEDGRERFRLHVGYFDSAARAHEALAVIRRYFPSAWISVAPRTSLGSLDDTMNTSFQMLRRAAARVVTPDDFVLPPATPAASPAPEAARTAAARPTADGPQRYVVQLDSADTPISSDAIPRLAIFRAYNLYRVRMLRDGAPQHALRLGFFSSVDSARQVADHVRGHYPRAGVVPVSHREYTRAYDLTQKVAARALAAAKSLGDQPVGEAPPPAARAPTAPAAPPAAKRATERLPADLFSLLGADDLKIDRSDARAGGNAEDRLHAARRSPRNIRSW